MLDDTVRKRPFTVTLRLLNGPYCTVISDAKYDPSMDIFRLLTTVFGKVTVKIWMTALVELENK
jgi:hypothetical protein